MSRYADLLSPNATPNKPSKTQKSRARREPSGVFSLFQAPQIQQFKEAFQLIDHDKDGWVNESDLKEIFTSLGTMENMHLSFWIEIDTPSRNYAFEENAGRPSQRSSRRP
jgi:hypothetical protein